MAGKYTPRDSTPYANKTGIKTVYPSAEESVATFDSAQFAGNQWELDQDYTWRFTGQVPVECPNPFVLVAPADLAKATSLLIPGQPRTGSFPGQLNRYTTVGGLRFDGSSHSDIRIYSPIDGYVTKVANYQIDGEQQYGFDIIHPCGILARLNHVRSVTAKFEAIADTDVLRTEFESFNTSDTVLVKAGEQIGASTGLEISDNTFVEFGLYDLRQLNPAAQKPGYQKVHFSDREFSWYGLCWPELLTATDAAIVKALPPGDTNAGRDSDYCT